MEEEEKNSKKKKTHPWNTGQRQDAMHHCRESWLRVKVYGIGRTLLPRVLLFFLLCLVSVGSSLRAYRKALGYNELNFVQNEKYVCHTHVSNIYMLFIGNVHNKNKKITLSSNQLLT